MSCNVFGKSQWIWSNKEYTENEYAEFYDEIDYANKNTILRISVCGEYTLFINGKYVSSNQYADYPHYKVYDEIDISEFLTLGNNTICFLVWYFGKSGDRYFTPNPGLIYEIIANDQIVSYSSADTYSRKSLAFKSGEKKKISSQLGYSFSYDATKEDLWLKGNGEEFSNSCKMPQKCNFYLRPVSRLSVGNICKAEIIDSSDGYILDLGKEVVGFLNFSIISDKEQDINIAYGEIKKKGHVKRIIGDRDFSIDYRAKAGKNEYCNYMFRFACRYLEIKSESPITIENIGILPQFYPVKENEITLSENLDRQIYDICLNTLKLCMLEHYVDCPWREQCMYAFDSRNQMLSGYVAFEHGNVDYARANLILMSKDNRSDNLTSICFPSANDLTIPSFSLYYILAVKEYVEFSNDLTLAKEVFEKLKSILNVFVSNMKDGLVCKISGKNRWHFYDWSDYAYCEILEGNAEPDFLLNCIVIIALKSYGFVCRKLNVKNEFEGIDLQIAEAAFKKYYNKNTGLFFINDINEGATELANSLAVVAEVAKDEIAKNICEQLCANSLLTCSLSMKTFKYDALIKINKDKYKTSILKEIRSTYKTMLDKGSFTVWETIEGEEAFDNAGSLCHGWSAIPIYYLKLLSENQN